MQTLSCWQKPVEVLKNNSNHINRQQHFPCTLVNRSEIEKINLASRPPSCLFRILPVKFSTAFPQSDQ